MRIFGRTMFLRLMESFAGCHETNGGQWRCQQDVSENFGHIFSQSPEKSPNSLDDL